MNMPNQYYNQGRRRGNQPGGMFYQTPMGMPTSMQSDPAMAMQMQNNYDVASGAYQGQRPPGMGRPPLMPNEMPSQPSPRLCPVCQYLEIHCKLQTSLMEGRAWVGLCPYV